MMADKLFTKRLRELTDDAIRESLAEISVEFEKRFGPAALTASPPVEREAIARIIEPETWVILDKHFKHASEPDFATSRYRLDKPDEFAAPSLAKADAILALTPERERQNYDGWSPDFPLSTPVAQGDEVRDALEVGAAREASSKFRTIGENWSTAGRLELPLAMGPRLSDAAKERLRKLEELDAIALMEACKYPLGGRFMYHDEEGEHDPAYVVIPGGEMLPINGYADGDAPIPTDVARAAFIVTACNAALSTPATAQGDVRGALEPFARAAKNIPAKFADDRPVKAAIELTPDEAKAYGDVVSAQLIVSFDGISAGDFRKVLATLTKGARDAG